MSGAVTQLLAQGAQDEHLTGNPQVSFFRSNYKQHTKFAQSVERQTFSGNPQPGSMNSIIVDRKGDLLNYMYLTATDTSSYSAINTLTSNTITTTISAASLASNAITAISTGATTTLTVTSSVTLVAGNYVVISGQTLTAATALPNGIYTINSGSSGTSVVLAYTSTGTVTNGYGNMAVAPVTQLLSGVNVNGVATTYGSNVNAVNMSASLNASAYLAGHYVVVTANEGSGPYQVAVTPTNAALLLIASNYINTVTEIYLGPVVRGATTTYNFGAVQSSVLPANIEVQVLGVSPSSFNGLFAVSSSTLGSVTLTQDSRNYTIDFAYGSIQRPSNKIQTIDWSKAIDKIELYIGGQLIDTQDSVFNYLVEPVAMADTYSKRFHGIPTASPVNTCINTFYPLKFFFCKDFHNSLPLVGMQFQTVQLNIYWQTTMSSSYQYDMWANYIYLQGPERDYFTNLNGSVIDMLVWQVQRQLVNADYYTELAFSNPVKFLAANVLPYVTGYQQIITKINGIDVGIFKGLPHYQEVSQYYNTPYGLTNPGSPLGSGSPAPLLIIPYCLDTARLQPTGSLNFSKIDTYRIQSPMGSGVPLMGGSGNNIFPPGSYIYAVNYNILRVQNAMASLVYAN